MDEFEKIQKKISDSTKKIFSEAIDNIAEQLPDDEAKEDFVKRMKKISAEGIDAVINGQDYQKYLEQGAYETSVWLANHYADTALNSVYEQLPEGKTRDKISDALNELTRKGIECFCRGESLEVIKAELSTIAKTHLKKYVKEQAKAFSKDTGKKIYTQLKFKGKGSREPNRYLKKATGMFSDELTLQITDNFGSWLDGRKNFGDATVDIAVNTTKNSAVSYTKEHGADLAAKALKELATRAEKEIKNQTIREGSVRVLNKLADSNTLTNIAGTVYDIGSAFKRLLKGEITEAEFLREIGEKGTSAVVSGVYATVGTTAGTLIAGPLGGAIGGAIGSAVGYFATNLLYGAVLQSLEEAKISHQRYEAMKAFCDYYIPEMERQRLEFKRKVAQFLSDRQQVIDTSLNRFEEAVRNKDFDGVSSALNNIAEEFGGSLQFKNFNELNRFMLDKNSTLVL